MKITSPATAAAIAFTPLALGVPTSLQARQSSGTWFGVNVLELRWCRTPWSNLSKCFKVYDDQAEASRDSAENCPIWSLNEDGWGDAFRHCYWSGRMVISIGVNDAKTVGDLHENGAPVNDPARKAMDLANNETGRQCGTNATASAVEDKYSEVRKCCWDLASKWPPALKVLQVTQFSPKHSTPCSGLECLQR